MTVRPDAGGTGPEDAVVMLAERRRRKLERVQAALPVLDRALADYGRRHNGCFIRFGSSATGTLRITSDIDIVAIFEQGESEACRIAEHLCLDLDLDLDLRPDCRPASWLTPAFVERAWHGGIVLP